MTTQQFYPRWRYISNITQAQYAVVTFTDTMDWTIGEIVSFRTSRQDGMGELNQKTAQVLSVIDAFNIMVNYDTSNLPAFIYPSTATTPPTMVPSASGVIPGLYPATMNLLDSYDVRRAG